MTLRAASSNFKLHASAKQLFSLLQGVPKCAPRHLGLGDRFYRHVILGQMGSIGLGSDYFFGRFLEGAEHALRHTTALVAPSGSSRELLSEDVQALLGARDSRQATNGLRLTWDIEDITDSSLGLLRLVSGVRRGEPIDHTNAFKSELGGICLVMFNDDLRTCSGADLFKREATLSVDALIKCRQSVTLSTADGEPVAESLHSEAHHILRLEVGLRKIDDMREGREMDGERGWIVTDLNRALGGNCVAAGIKTWTQSVCNTE